MMAYSSRDIEMKTEEERGYARDGGERGVVIFEPLN